MKKNNFIERLKEDSKIIFYNVDQLKEKTKENKDWVSFVFNTVSEETKDLITYFVDLITKDENQIYHIKNFEDGSGFRLAIGAVLRQKEKFIIFRNFLEKNPDFYEQEKTEEWEMKDEELQESIKGIGYYFNEVMTFFEVQEINNNELLTLMDKGRLEVIDRTEKEQIIKSRIGQSVFRNKLLNIEMKCKLCGASDERFLIASHIKPWVHSNNKERLDVDNGLLLCPNHDALFDKGYISFEDNGDILISASIDESTRLLFNINNKFKIKMNKKQLQYMQWHRENKFVKNNMTTEL
ncbi:HNH endonuclease signature motif containing protein [Neobacillus sp. SuZ13]|uniref:HNH endonuclease n=1 Tax=Neobacillus sp. SuZ13 TaxID=3047875 RepID=UPI0024C001A9|nr:HNH endonuclease signature motif containing protein [Neobacillus sp. SuZ13]WHY65640.1 HNH endonuclease signature motif containing protein [Neobacillus sp. SuZ13]